MLTLIQALVKMVLAVIEFFLMLRFLFRLFGANPAAPFVRWLYDMSDSLLHPFQSIFPVTRVDGFVVEFTTLVALLIYVLIGYLILVFIEYVDRVATERPL